MWVESFRYDLWPSPRRARSLGPETVGEAPAAKFGDHERYTVPWYERRLLAALLLVVVGWSILRLVLTLLGLH